MCRMGSPTPSYSSVTQRGLGPSRETIDRRPRQRLDMPTARTPPPQPAPTTAMRGSGSRFIGGRAPIKSDVRRVVMAQNRTREARDRRDPRL